MPAAMPGMIDCIVLLRRQTTNPLRLRRDRVHAARPAFAHS
jgi:hypothetical protein